MWSIDFGLLSHYKSLKDIGLRRGNSDGVETGLINDVAVYR